MRVATGLAIGTSASPELAAKAVEAAMLKANIHAPSSVLLFLTSEFAADPTLAIKAAAKAASCMQIVGCSATGIFTEEDWVVDSPAAAAMVFADDVVLNAPSHQLPLHQHELLLTLTAPSAINSTWLQNAAARFGGVSGDAIGQGHFSVWQNGKGNTQGYCEVTISNTKAAVAATHGLKILTSARRVTETQQNDLLTIANIAAYSTLLSAWQKHHKLAAQSKQNTELPYHQLMAVHASKASLIENGDYMISSIVIADEDNRSVTLSKPVKTGDWMSWAIRDTDAAQIDIVKTTNALKHQLAVAPAFGLLFSSLGRGPYFYNGQDLDLALIKTLLPNMPLIGFYGNGEIAPINGANTLLEYSAVLGLFADENV